jgi:mannose-6-phosphate isomerase-like protein (cupin superfamily)
LAADGLSVFRRFPDIGIRRDKALFDIPVNILCSRPSVNGVRIRRSDMSENAGNIEDIGPRPQSFDIEDATIKNSNYRTVAWSGRYLQVTMMSIPVGTDIGLEAHPETDQFLRLEAGTGRVQMGGDRNSLTFERDVSDGSCILVPAGTWHNVTNTGDKPMQLYTIYAPAHHRPSNVQATAQEARLDRNDEPATWSMQPSPKLDEHG